MMDDSYEIRIMGRLLTVRAAAGALGLSEKTVRLWISDGRLGYVKLGRATRIPESQVLELVARGHHRSTE